MMFDSSLISVSQDSGEYQITLKNDLSGNEYTLTAQQVVVEMGTQPIDDVFHELREQSITDIDAIAKGEE